MTTTVEDAWDEVITRLKAITNILKVYEGWTDFDSAPHSHYPCIVVEPTYEEPEFDSYNFPTSYAKENLGIVVWVLFKIFEKDKQVTGTALLDGAFDWKNAVKDKLLELPLYLNEEVIEIRFTRVLYLRAAEEEPELVQLRVVQMEIALDVMLCGR